MGRALQAGLTDRLGRDCQDFFGPYDVQALNALSKGESQGGPFIRMTARRRSAYDARDEELLLLWIGGIVRAR